MTEERIERKPRGPLVRKASSGEPIFTEEIIADLELRGTNVAEYERVVRQAIVTGKPVIANDIGQGG